MHAYLTYQTELEYKGILASKKNSEKAYPLQKHVFFKGFDFLKKYESHFANLQ